MTLRLRDTINQSVRGLREMARSWGGDLVVNSPRLYGRLARARGFARYAPGT